MNQKKLILLKLLSVFALVYMAMMPALVLGQVEIRLNENATRCDEDVIRLKHVASVVTRDPVLTSLIEDLEIDAFDENVNRVTVSKEQVKITLLLEGLRPGEFQVDGNEQISVVRMRSANVGAMVEMDLEQRIADQYGMSLDDLDVTVDPQFGKGSRSKLDYSTLEIQNHFRTELTLGRQSFVASAMNESGKKITVNIPATVAVIRDLAVATKNISKGQLLTKENIKSVRRPVAGRNVRFASFEQVIGKQIQNDIQQHDLIKSTVVKVVSIKPAVVIKRNSIVSVTVRSGSLLVRIPDAKAMADGRLGEQISFLNRKTKKEIIATVTGPSKAEVNY